MTVTEAPITFDAPGRLWPLLAAAEILGGVSKRSLERAIARKQITAVKLGGRTFLHDDELKRIAREGYAAK